MMADLDGVELWKVLEMLERGKIGHSDAMNYLHIDSYTKLVEIMHYNGRLMPGHQPMKLTRATWDAVAAACAPRDNAHAVAIKAAE